MCIRHTTNFTLHQNIKRTSSMNTKQAIVSTLVTNPTDHIRTELKIGLYTVNEDFFVFYGYLFNLNIFVVRNSHHWKK